MIHANSICQEFSAYKTAARIDIHCELAAVPVILVNPGNGVRPKKNIYPSIVKNNKGAQILIYNPQLPPKNGKE